MGTYQHQNGCSQQMDMMMLIGIERIEISHTLTTTTTGSKSSQKEVNNQTDLQSLNSLGPPKVPALQVIGLS